MNPNQRTEVELLQAQYAQREQNAIDMIASTTDEVNKRQRLMVKSTCYRNFQRFLSDVLENSHLNNPIDILISRNVTPNIKALRTNRDSFENDSIEYRAFNTEVECFRTFQHELNTIV